MKKVRVKVGDKEYEILVEETGDNKLKVIVDNEEHEVDVSEVEEKSELEQNKMVRSPMPGTISKVMVETGKAVKKGEPLVLLLAMKMENSILAPVSGIVKAVFVKDNDTVEADQVLLEIE